MFYGFNTGSATGTEDEYGCKHLKLYPQTTPTTDADYGFLYAKTVSSLEELHYKDGGASQTETQITSAGYINGAALKPDSVDSAHYAAASIDNEHLADGAVDTEELAADAIDGTKIADDAVDSEHLAAGGIDSEHLSATVKDSIIKGWVRFDGTGDCTPADSFNVSSVTDNGTGDYTINWDTDFANTNYCVVGSANRSTNYSACLQPDTFAVGSVRVFCVAGDNSKVDCDVVCVMAIGDQ